MPVKKLGFADTIENPFCGSDMLGKHLIVVGDSTARRFGSARVVGLDLGSHVLREQGVAVILSKSHRWAAEKVNDRNSVPDPVCIVVTKGEPVEPVLIKACKARGAELVVLREGFAAVAICTNERLFQGTALEILSQGKPAEKPKRPKLKRSVPKPPKAEVPEPAPKPETPRAE